MYPNICAVTANCSRLYHLLTNYLVPTFAYLYPPPLENGSHRNILPRNEHGNFRTLEWWVSCYKGLGEHHVNVFLQCKHPPWLHEHPFVRKLDLSQLCFSLNFCFLIFLRLFPSMFLLLTYSQSFFFLICWSPETLKMKEQQDSIQLVQEQSKNHFTTWRTPQDSQTDWWIH